LDPLIKRLAKNFLLLDRDYEVNFSPTAIFTLVFSKESLSEAAFIGSGAHVRYRGESVAKL
jgi:hypothetical protein